MPEKRKDKKGRLLRTGESQRENGLYQYRYEDSDGRRAFVYSWRLTEADDYVKGKRQDVSLRAKEAEVLEKIAKGCNVRKSGMTLVKCIEDYFAVKVFANSTRVNYEYYFAKDIKPHQLGRMSINSIKKSDIRKFYTSLNKKGYSDGTIQILHKIIHPALDMCVEDEIIGKNPSDGCCRNYVRQKKKEALTAEQQQILFEKIIRYNRNHKKYKIMFTILLGLSCRINELIGLTWNEIDLANRTVKIEHGLVYRRKNGKHQFYITKDTCKNSERLIPMTDDVYKCFEELDENRLDNRSEVVIDGYSDFVFVSANKTPIMPANINDELTKMIKKYRSDTGNTFPNVSVHIFRHTGCTNMVEAGVELNTIMHIMGHRNIKMIMDVYDTVSFERLQKQIKKLDKQE